MTPPEYGGESKQQDCEGDKHGTEGTEYRCKRFTYQCGTGRFTKREVEEMKGMLLEKEDKMEHLLKQAARLLANNTEYAAMISAPQYHRNKLKFIQLSRVDANQILAVIVVEGNVIKNSILPVSEELHEPSASG